MDPIENQPAEAPEAAIPETEVNPEVQPEAQPEPETKETETKQDDLYELPDGRKVDAKTLTKEWKDNFLPEFTRRSQRLKEYESPKGDANKQPEQKNQWDDPNWQPKTWQEVFDANERRAEAKQQASRAQDEQDRARLNAFWDSQIAEIRKTEPDLNEDILFTHAAKYKFADLKGAYQNMKDLNLAVKSTERKVVQNMKARSAAAAPTGDGGHGGDGMTYGEFLESQSESPLEALRRLSHK